MSEYCTMLSSNSSRSLKNISPATVVSDRASWGFEFHKNIRFVEVPAGAGRAGRALKAWGTCLCIVRRHGAIPDPQPSPGRFPLRSASYERQDGGQAEHQRRRPSPTERAKQAREADPLEINNLQLK